MAAAAAGALLVLWGSWSLQASRSQQTRHECCVLVLLLLLQAGWLQQQQPLAALLVLLVLLRLLHYWQACQVCRGAHARAGDTQLQQLQAGPLTHARQPSSFLCWLQVHLRLHAVPAGCLRWGRQAVLGLGELPQAQPEDPVHIAAAASTQVL